MSIISKHSSTIYFPISKVFFKFFVKDQLLFDHLFCSKSGLTVSLTILLLSRYFSADYFFHHAFFKFFFLASWLDATSRVDEFLAHHLEDSAISLASSLDLLLETGSKSDDSVFSAAWSVRDPSSSFYRNVFDLIFFSPGPAMPSDAIRSIQRLVEQTMTVRGMQTPFALVSFFFFFRLCFHFMVFIFSVPRSIWFVLQLVLPLLPMFVLVMMFWW